MAERSKPCPGCGGEPYVDLPRDESRSPYLECNKCTFRANEEDWLRRTPGPATAKLIRCIKADLEPSDKMLDAFLAEWAEPATPPAPESPEAASPWKCSICGAPVRIGADLRPWHMNGPTSHEAELSDADLKFLADGLRLTD